MNNLFVDLYAHQEWADAEHWNALEACAEALIDTAIVNRLHHIYMVQQAYSCILHSKAVTVRRPEEFTGIVELKSHQQLYHKEIMSFLSGRPEAWFDSVLTIPWFKKPPISVTVTQALVQTTMHSHYHRAQNATRLRELGGEPPLIDLIAWYWKGRPQALWTS